jgi:predicted RNase H-like HicB family nuclease
MPLRVYLEQGSKRVFAGALDWPGWIRSGKDREAALAALAEAATRYAPVARSAGFPLPAKAAESLVVVETVKGNATTDFGAPGIPAKVDSEKLTTSEAKRQRALVEASWSELDKVVASAPQSLRKGPRGGGRDRDQIVEHVLGAESAYAGALGVKLKQPPAADAKAVKAFREAILAGLEAAGEETKWPARYAARRIAWHALFHAWEIEDRSD